MVQISTHLNARQKGGLPSDKMENDGHCMVIVTRSGKILDDDVVSLENDHDKEGGEGKANAKRKRTKKLN